MPWYRITAQTPEMFRRSLRVFLKFQRKRVYVEVDGQSFIAGVPRKHIAFVRNMRREFGIKISKPLSQDEALEIINLATQAEKKLILKTDKQDPTYTEGMTMVQEVQGVKITFNRQRATKMVMVAKQAQEALEGFFQKAGLRGEMKVSLVRQRTGSPHTQGIRFLPFNGQDVLLAVQLGGNDSRFEMRIHPPQDVDAETLHKQLEKAIEGSAAQNKSGQEDLSTQELVETDGTVIQDNRSDHETPDENKRMEFRVVQLVKHIVWGYPSQHRALRRCRRKFIGSMNIPCEDASEPNCFYARVEADRYTDFRRYVRSLHLWSAEATEGVALAVLITTQQELEKNEPELSKKKAKKGTGEVSVEAQQNGSTAPENLPDPVRGEETGESPQSSEESQVVDSFGRGQKPSKEELRQARSQGLTIPQMAEKWNVRVSTISRLLKQAGLVRSNKTSTHRQTSKKKPSEPSQQAGPSGASVDIKTTFSGIKEQRVALVVEIERIEKKLATAQERLTQRKKELTTAQEQLIQYDKEVLDGLKELGIQVPTTIE